MNKKKARNRWVEEGIKIIWLGYERLFDCLVFVLSKHQNCDADNLSVITETSLSNFNMFK